MPQNNIETGQTAWAGFRKIWWAVPVLILLHWLLSLQLFHAWRSSPVLLVEMSSTVSSRAQVYYDTGAGFIESQSDTVAVQAAAEPQTLRLRLANATVKALRFDPLTAPGTILIRRAVILRSDGSIAATFPPSRIKGVTGFDREDVLPTGVQYRVRSDSNDPQFLLTLQAPLDLKSTYPGHAVIGKIALVNILITLVDLLVLFLIPRLTLISALPRNRISTVWVLVPHVLLSWAYLKLGTPPPTLLVHMSSSVFSRAQVYYDIGQGLSESQSASLPVSPSATPREFRLPLPHGQVRYLRFDPLTCPGTIFISRMDVLRSDGTIALSVPPSNLQGILGFDAMDTSPAGVRFHVRPDSYDPGLLIPLTSPIDLESHNPGPALLLRLALLNLTLICVEALLLLWPPGRNWFQSLVRSADSWALKTAARLSNTNFLVFDRLAVWFYVICFAAFLVFTAADFNGSSMGVFWRNYKVGAPSKNLAGVPQQIRADEFNYMTPGMLNQVLREQPFSVAESSFGGHSAALLSVLPIHHVTTLVRPQYWPFFVLPADFAFAAWWQAKWLILITGVFTLLLLITESSMLAIAGALWLFFSQFTQWCYTWPSMLPEMGGLFCFAVVCACYLLVGTRKLALGFAAIACAACAVNFAMMAYVPHLIPYTWAGLFFVTAWCIANRETILRPEARLPRMLAGLACLLLIAGFMLTVLNQSREAVQGIAATTYPGHRSMNGGQFLPSIFGSHFFGAFESDTRVPSVYPNICEASGFLWLAPVTLLCFGQIRRLPEKRRILLGGLWAAALLLASWTLLPIPASWGSILFLDRVQAVRVLPALGFLNIAIVMAVLSAPGRSQRLGLDVTMTIMLPLTLLVMVVTNRSIGSLFSPSELIIGTLWTGILAALLWSGRKKLFIAAVLIPSIFLFGLINPVQRGIDPITSSTLFQIVHSDKRLLHGKWLIFPEIFPASIFIAVGCDVFNGSKYLPDIDRFPLYAAHGLDTRILNNLGYVDVEELAPGKPPTVRRGPYGVVIGLSPLDSLVKDLGIRYMAFHTRPSPEILAHLKPIGNGNFSEFWLYEVQ